jgi:hypothetical protein
MKRLIAAAITAFGAGGRRMDSRRQTARGPVNNL